MCVSLSAHLHRSVHNITFFHSVIWVDPGKIYPAHGQNGMISVFYSMKEVVTVIPKKLYVWGRFTLAQPRRAGPPLYEVP